MVELGYLGGVSSNIQNQLDGKAPLASPALTGSPTAPTPTPFRTDNYIATTAYVQRALGSKRYTNAFTTNQILTTDYIGRMIYAYGTAPLTFTLPPGPVLPGSTIKIQNISVDVLTILPATGMNMLTTIAATWLGKIPQGCSVELIASEGGSTWLVTEYNGNYKHVVGIATGSTLSLKDAGNRIASNGGTITLPLLSTVPHGTVFDIWVYGSILYINRSGSDVLHTGIDASLSQIRVKPGQNVKITKESVWEISGLIDYDFSAQNYKAENGYQYLPGNMILQWGTYTLANGATPTIYYTIPFPNVCLFISIPYNQGGPAYETFYTAKYNTHFIAGNATGGPQYVSWFAIGY